MNNLFSPFQLTSKRQLKNRLAVAPMTTQQSNEDGSLSNDEFEWLTRLSNDGYGLVITCAASISSTSTAFHNQLSIAKDEYIPELKKLTDAMKERGSMNLIQLCHAGSRSIEKLTGEKPHSASAYVLDIPDFEAPLELSKEQIHEIIADFSNACLRAEKAGFDGVELHGANGYLFTQFISTMTNLRTDEYGGSLENRARFSREVVRACREKVSDNFIIGFRLSFEGMGMETGLDIDENITITNWLAQDGIDYIHSSHLMYKANTQKYPGVTTIEYLRKAINKNLPLVIAGSINSLKEAQDALDLGADLLAIGRSSIGNAHLPNYFAKGQELPFKTPFSEKHLREIGISEQFIDYVKNAPPLKSLSIVEP